MGQLSFGWDRSAMRIGSRFSSQRVQLTAHGWASEVLPGLGMGVHFALRQIGLDGEILFPQTVGTNQVLGCPTPGVC